MRSIFIRVVFWVAVIGLAIGVLFVVNQHKPKKPDLTPVSRPKKSIVSCFVNGSPVFTGEILGDIKLEDNRRISFFSLELNAEVQLLNGSCLVLERP